MINFPFIDLGLSAIARYTNATEKQRVLACSTAHMIHQRDRNDEHEQTGTDSPDVGSKIKDHYLCSTDYEFLSVGVDQLSRGALVDEVRKRLKHVVNIEFLLQRKLSRLRHR